MNAIACTECSLRASDSATGWQGHLVDLDDDGEDEVVFYCPACAEWEFGQQLDLADN